MDDALKLQLNKLQLSNVTSTDKIIGRGAYGKVIEVYVHGTLCAAKEIHPLLVETVSAQEFEVLRKSFYEECVKASRIPHPNIVQMLGIYYPTPQAKLPWLVMEMMETSLKGFLEKHEEGKVPLHFKLCILVDVAQGLEFLHGQDIIHRDLSSNNVLLTKHLVAKIADLGVAKVMVQSARKTQTKAPGTPDFMPPEALWKKPYYGKPVDIFSLACVALHVMSHLWPEPKERVSEDTMTVLTEMQRREEYIIFCTHPALKQLVELCLHNKPEQRPEVTAVCVKLKQLKVTIEKQIPFATDNNYELFSKVREANVQNKKLKDTVVELEATIATVQKQNKEKDLLIQEKDQQIQQKDQQIQQKDQQMQRKDQQIQEKDQQVEELQALHKCDIASTSKHQEEMFSVQLGRELNSGEYSVKLYLLRMRETEFSKFLVESVCVKGSTVLEFKKKLLEDMIDQTVEEAKDMAVNRMKIWKKMRGSPATVCLDHMIIDKDVQVNTNCEMYIEILKDEFPEHLLKLEKEREKREKEMCKLTLHSVHPEKKSYIQGSFAVHKGKSLWEATQDAHKLLKYDEVVPVEQCRLVKYDDYNEIMEESFDGQENHPFSMVLGGVLQYYNFDLFLEVRGKDEQFRVYKPGGVGIKVLVVHLESDQVLPPATVKAEQDWTVAELKKFLKSEFKLKGGVIRIVLEKYYTDLKPLENDDNTLKSEMFYRTSKVYLECSNSDDYKLTFEKSQMYKLIDKHMNTILLIINYPAVIQASVNSKEVVQSQDTKSSSGMKTNKKTKVLTIDKRTTVSEVKKMLEPCVKLMSNQFRLYRAYSKNQEFEMIRLTDTFCNIPSETKFSVRLGRALNPGEYRIKLYLLRMREIEFSKFLVESVCVKGSTVLEFKKQILEDVIHQKVEEAKDMTINRMRIRKKMWRSPASIFLDDMIIDKDVQVYTNCEMYIEMLKGNEVMTMPSQTQVYIIRWRPSTYTVDTYDEVILTDATPKHLKQQIAEKAGFPAEHVEFAKGIGSFPCVVSPLEIQEDLDWNPRISSINAWPLSIYDDGAVLYYRDSRERLGKLTSKRKAQIQKEDNARLSGMGISTGSSSSNKEKAFKI